MSTAAESDGRHGPTTELPTRRCRRTQAATDRAARTVLARKGIPATTGADIAEADQRAPYHRFTYREGGG